MSAQADEKAASGYQRIYSFCESASRVCLLHDPDLRCWRETSAAQQRCKQWRHTVCTKSQCLPDVPVLVS